MAAVPLHTLVMIGEELGRATAETENRLLEHVRVLSDRLTAAERQIAVLTLRLETVEKRDLRQALRPPARLRNVA